MKLFDLQQKLELNPVIAAVREEFFEEALSSPAQVIFLLEGDIISLPKRIDAVHQKSKTVFVHIDLIKGIGKDKSGLEFLANLGVDGILSTKSALIKAAKEIGILTVQRCFALDSQGLESIKQTVASSKPDMIEIMPGVIEKTIKKFAKEKIPVISGGLLENKAETLSALSAGAIAVSTGKKDLWYI